MTGTVVRINRYRGFFFIKPSDRSPDRFAHLTALRNTRFEELQENTPVRFTDDPGNPKGPRAEDVYVVSAYDEQMNEFENLFK